MTKVRSADPALWPKDPESLLREWDTKILAMAQQARHWNNVLFDPDDVAQELKIALLRSGAKYDPAKSPDRNAYLKVRLEWKLRSIYRKACESASLYIKDLPRAAVEANLDPVGTIDSDVDSRIRLDVAISTLPPKQRTALEYFRLGNTASDIAEKRNTYRQLEQARIAAGIKKLIATYWKAA